MAGYFNGIDGLTGACSKEPDLETLIAKIRAQPRDQWITTVGQSSVDNPYRALARDLDPDELAQAGWGLVLAPEDPNAAQIREALSPLLAKREEQAGQNFRIFEPEDTPWPDETEREWRQRHGVPGGPVSPDKIPYYLLFACGTQHISFSFQSNLGAQFAVGRLHFDSLDGYEHYAESVLAAEGKLRPKRRKASFFAVVNEDDDVTKRTAEILTVPLYENTKIPGWNNHLIFGKEATRARLQKLLSGPEHPDFLFFSGHGQTLPFDHPDQRSLQGALVCREWPGPELQSGPLHAGHYLAGDDLARGEGLQGAMVFLHACFSGGRPRYDSFHRKNVKTGARKILADKPFVSALPQQLLGYHAGGALAVVGHVDRVWCFSQDVDGHYAAYSSVINRLFKGKTIGHAMERLAELYACQAKDLVECLDLAEAGVQVDPYHIRNMWTQYHNARNFVLLGDPAVHF